MDTVTIYFLSVLLYRVIALLSGQVSVSFPFSFFSFASEQVKRILRF